jgi:hypothetical protein
MVKSLGGDRLAGPTTLRPPSGDIEGDEAMRCLECNHPIVTPGLLVAMEQREHFAMVRHAEVCQTCAPKLLVYLEHRAAESRYWRQSIDCGYCGSKLPITRMRFEIKDYPHRYIAICEGCYKAMRDDLLMTNPQIVHFIEKEWETLGSKTQKREPWPRGTIVRVRAQGRFHQQNGYVDSHRLLQMPWYGYEVRFANGLHHFFHERDLQVVEERRVA